MIDIFIQFVLNKIPKDQIIEKINSSSIDNTAMSINIMSQTKEIEKLCEKLRMEYHIQSCNLIDDMSEFHDEAPSLESYNQKLEEFNQEYLRSYAGSEKEFLKDIHFCNQGITKHPFCGFCLFMKPMRAHHCRICKQCILRMDHHCFFLSTCVGIGNYKAFFLTLCYVFLLIGFSFLTCLPTLKKYYFDPLDTDITYTPIIIYTLYMIVLAIAQIMIFVFLRYHTKYKILN